MGHTSGYCLEKKQKEQKVVDASCLETDFPSLGGGHLPSTTTTTATTTATATNTIQGWSQIAKKSMTDQDKSESEVISSKMKTDFADKKKRLHETYLAKKVAREQRIKEQNEYDDKRYELFRKHMWYLYGNKWMHLIVDNSIVIPRRLFNRVQDAIEKDNEDEWNAELEYNRIDRERREADEKEYAEMEATFTHKEYMDWMWKKSEALDEQMDLSECIYLQGVKIVTNEKMWIAEQMAIGKIREINQQEYEYYP